MTRRSVTLGRIFGVAAWVGFACVAQGWANSGTVKEPNYLGMLVSLATMVAVVWAWVASISMVSDMRWRPILKGLCIFALVLTGFISGPLVLFILRRRDG